MAAADDDTPAIARRWIEQRDLPSAAWLTEPAQAVALAWAVKDLCYAAWASEPPYTQRAAQALADLHGQAALQLPNPSTPLTELLALSQWTAAVALLAGGQMADAIVQLDLAAGSFASIGADAPAAQTRVPRIMALSMLGRHADAVACAEDAQRRFTALGDRPSAAKTSLNLGSLHLRHDAYADAAQHYRQASGLFARIGDRQHSVMADIGMADALTALGDGDEAARIYARARMRAATHGLPVLQALVDESMALLDLSRGRYGVALAGLEQARRAYAALDMPQHLAIAEKQLADAYLELRLLPEALALYGPALARMQALQMPDDVAWTLAQRGRAEALSGDVGAAADAFAQAAQAFAAQDSPVGMAAVDLARAELALASGDAAGAAGHAARAAAGFQAAGLAGAQLRAGITAAEAALAGGSAAAARAGFLQLLAQARQAQMLSAQVRCQVGLGELALHDGNRAGAQAAFGAAVDLFEAQRRALPADDVRIAFLTDHLRPYQALLQLALHAHTQHPGPAQAAQVLHWLDRTRARALGERVAQGAAAAGPTTAATAALRSRLSWLHRRLQQQQDEGGSATALEQARRDLEQQLLETTRRERLATAAASGPAAADDDLAATLMQQLQPGDAVVEFGHVDGQLFACVVLHNGVQVVTALAPLAAVVATLQSARFQIEALRHGAGRLAQHLPQLTTRAQAWLQRLHGLLWAPLAPALGSAARVLVVAPAELGGLPFAALHDGECWLHQRHAIAVAPSAQWACLALARTVRPLQRAVIVAESSRLPHAGAEALAVAALFDQSTLLLDGAATAGALQAHAANADLLHLACHADYRSDNPMFSALHLHDGPLTAERIEGLALRPATVVLSACDTGLGAGAVGDEHIGLVRAFFVAGAARVLASLWPVDDAVTDAFMRVFYRGLLAGAAPATALRQAQARLRHDNPHPYFWAAFTLHGGW